MTEVKGEGEKQTTIFYDGECPMCTALIKKVERSPKKNSFRAIDARHDQLPDNLERGAALKEIHVVDERGGVYKNAGAIFKILEAYPRLRFIARIGNVPFLKPVFTWTYRFVALNRFSFFGPDWRAFSVKIILTAAMAMGLILSVNLWLSNRFYPLSPIIPELGIAISPWLDYLIFLSSLTFLLLAFFSSEPRRWLAFFLVVALWFIATDESRLQPWFYQYFFMLALLSLYSFKTEGNIRRDQILHSLRIIVAGIYFWSGIQKLNLHFLTSTFPWLITPLLKLLPDSFSPFLMYAGILVPFVEAGIGIGLLTSRLRSISIVAAVALHGIVLLLLGPFGRNWNNVVWPWNVAMICFVIALFVKTNGVSARAIIAPGKFYLKSLMLLLFVIMPAFNMWGLWDSYLSASLYTGLTKTATIKIDAATYQMLPSSIVQYAAAQKGSYFLDITRWSFKELNVPPYPEERIYQNVTRGLCRYFPSKTSLTLIIYEPSRWGNDILTSIESRCSEF